MPMNCSPEPIRLGAMKSPRVSEKVKIEPATTAGSTSGKTTRRNV